MVHSAGSNTPEWFVNTFVREGGGRFRDVVYISGSPAIPNRRFRLGRWEYDAPRIFYRVVEAWRLGWRRFGQIYTCHPNEVFNLFKFFYTMRPNRRYIVHFVQPHLPSPFEPRLFKYCTPDRFGADSGLWEALKRGEVNREIVFSAYVRNFMWVMKYVKRIVELCKGKRIIVTADHGECFGEDGIYDHPEGVEHPILRYVPWLRVIVP